MLLLSSRVGSCVNNDGKRQHKGSSKALGKFNYIIFPASEKNTSQRRPMTRCGDMGLLSLAKNSSRVTARLPERNIWQDSHGRYLYAIPQVIYIKAVQSDMRILCQSSPQSAGSSSILNNHSIQTLPDILAAQNSCCSLPHVNTFQWVCEGGISSSSQSYSTGIANLLLKTFHSLSKPLLQFQ